MTVQWTPSDPVSWEMTKSSLIDDGERGHAFLVFLNFWLNTAEKLMSEPVDFEKPLGPGVYPPSPANAIRQALEIVESSLGPIDCWYMGQLLVVIGTYWQHGDEAMRGFSAIELKVTAEMLARKINELQREAGTDDDTDGPGDGEDLRVEDELDAQRPDAGDEPDRRDDDRQ